MKKKMKKIYFLICIIAISFSCTESFLEEELVSNLTTDYYDTPQGLNELLNASYNGSLRWRFGGEYGFTLANYGVDEMTVGNGTDMIEYNDYNSNLMPDDRTNKLSSEFWSISIVWRDLWYVIKLCNTGIEKVKSIDGEPFHTEALRKNAEGQFRFIRAFCYFDLVQQFGSAPLLAEYSTKIETECPKASVEDIYKQIILDFRTAIPYLNEVASEPGRITKGAARHFLAKAFLTRSSAVNRSWNSNYTSDLDSAIYYADQVIAQKGTIYDLEPDYAGLFNYTTPDGPNEKSKEIILAAQFTNNLVAIDRGNRLHLYVGTWYEDIAGLDRDIANDRPWRRLMPTNYAYDVFDRENDSRFYKSFKFAYMANVAGGAPLGDTTLVFIVNRETEPIDSAVIKTWRYKAFVRYVRSGSGDIKKEMPDNVKNHFAPISKHFDHTRPAIQQEEGYRDGILARFAETYLIAAEAYGLRGNYDKAMEYINVLRSRAAYKAGEVRKPLYYMIENNDPSNPGTENNLLIQSSGELTSIPSDPVQAKYFPPSADSPEEIFMCHILNERARELMCEMVRWQDLARTGTLIERATLYNGTAKPIAGKHELRPIPQTFIDGLQIDGRPLTTEEKIAYQNPGY